MDKNKHISNNLIIAWIAGELEDFKEIELIEDHMDQCDRCFQLMTDFSISYNEVHDYIIETEEGKIIADVKTSKNVNSLSQIKEYFKHFVTDPAPPQPVFGRLIPAFVVSIFLGFFVISITLNNTYTYSLQERVIRTSVVSSNKPDVFIDSEVLKVVFEELPVDVIIKIQSLNGEFLHKEILSKENQVYSFELDQLNDKKTDYDLIIYDKEKKLLYDGRIRVQ